MSSTFPEQITIEAETSEIVPVEVEITEDVESGESSIITLTAISQTDPTIIDSDGMEVTYSEYDVNVIAPDDVIETEYGIYTYHFNVENTGELDDTYDLEAFSEDPDNFPIVDHPEEITVEAGVEEEVGVEIEITEDVGSDDSAEITLMATSQNQGTLFDEDSMEVTYVEKYELTVENPENGTVFVDGIEVTDEEETFEYEVEEIVDLEGIAHEGYYFVKWIGETESIGETTENQTDIEMLDDYEITAEFEQYVTLTIEDITGEGTVSVDGEEVTETPFVKEYEQGEETDLLADPAEYWYFENWEGIPEEEADIALIMEEDEQIENVLFERYNILTVEEAEGEGDIYVDGELVEEFPSTEEYEDGTVVELDATPAEDFVFDRWTVDEDVYEESTINLTMDEDKTVQANFTESFELTIDEVFGEGDIYVDGEIVEELPFTEEHQDGEEADLLADPAEGWEFSHWTGVPEEQEEDPDILLEMDQDRTVTATFEEVEYTLAIDSTEGGEVVEPGEEEYTYDAGETVDLEAVADEDYHFVEWTGDIGTIEDPTSSDTTITMEDDYTITAEFEETEVDSVIIFSEKEVVEAGEELNFTAEALDEDENVIEDDPEEFEWQNADGSGLFVEIDTGEYDVTATYEGVTSSVTTVTVEPAEVSSVEIDTIDERPATAGEDLWLTAYAYDGYDNLITEDVSEFEWENIYEIYEDEDVAIFYEEEIGEYEVTATYEGISDVITITVEPGDPSVIDVIDHPDLITAGESFEVTLEVYDDMDNLITDTELNEFAVESEHDGEVHFEESITLDSDGQYTAVISEDRVVSAEEDHTLTLSSNPSGSFQMTVEPGEADNVEIIPSEYKEIEVSDKLEFTAAVYDEYGNLITEDVNEFEWENIDEIDEERNVAVFYHDEPGEYQVRAEYDGVTSALITVEIEEVTEDPTGLMTELCSLWWLWLVAIIVILLIGGSYWKKRKKEVKERETGVKTVRRELQKAKKEPKKELSDEEAEEIEEQMEEPAEELTRAEAVEEFQKVKGIGPTTAKNLYEENFETLEQLKEASVEELTEVKGIGEATAEKIFDNLKG